jgi:hypothetical protein
MFGIVLTTGTMSSKKRKMQDAVLMPGPSSNLITAPETTPAKRRRKEKDVDTPLDVVEKRAAIFKKACPKVIMERVDRVMSQRLVSQTHYICELGKTEECFQIFYA